MIDSRNNTCFHVLFKAKKTKSAEDLSPAVLLETTRNEQQILLLQKGALPIRVQEMPILLILAISFAREETCKREKIRCICFSTVRSATFSWEAISRLFSP